MSTWIHHIAKVYWRIRKPLTLGARAIIIDEHKSVLLVRHSYLLGWYLPGGGVEKGETFFAAIRRELREECAVEAIQLRLCHLYYSEREGKRDHIALFHVSDYRTVAGQSPDPEVEEVRFFSWEDLPADTTPATRRRLTEFRTNQFEEEWW